MSATYDTPVTPSQATSDLSNNTNISAQTQTLITNSIPAGATTVGIGQFSGGTFSAPTGVAIPYSVILPPSDGSPVSIQAAQYANTTKNWIANPGVVLNFDGRVAAAAAAPGQQATSVDGYIVVGAEGNDTIQGGNLADNITGAGGNDSIATYAGDDTIVTGIGVDTVDGGTGFDVAQVAGTRTGWTAAKSGTEVVLTSTASAANVAHLKNVDFISFTGATGKQTSVVVSGTEAEGNAMRLYQGLFDRSADQGGAQYWEAQVRGGASTDAIATQFLLSNEFKSANPTQTNTQFVEMLYQQALGRTADTGGLNYWVGQLDQGASKGAVAVGIIDSQEGMTHIDNVIVLIGTV